MIPDLQIEHPPFIPEDGRVEIECGIRKAEPQYEQPMEKCVVCFGKNYEGLLYETRELRSVKIRRDLCASDTLHSDGSPY
jgi:hypothetical protein